MTAAERAETYLRLTAESELRRTLAFPRHEAPAPSGPAPAVRLSSPLFAPLLPAVRTAARLSGPLIASLWPAARTAASATRQTTVGRAAEPVLWRALRARHAVRPFLAGRDRVAKPPAEAGLDRVRLVASALVQAGVIGEAAAQAMLGSLTDALAIRGQLTPGQLYLPLVSPSWGPGSRWLPASSPPPLPRGPVRAIPLGTTLPLGSGGHLGEAGLLALVLAPDRAVLTAAAWLTEPRPSAGRPGRGPPALLPFGALVATDEHGAHYQADHTAQPAYGRWSVAFDLAPVPPPGIRRLDITGPAIKAPIRVDLIPAPGSGYAAGPDTADSDCAGPDPDPAPADPGRPDPGLWGGLLARPGPAERPLDTLAERLLADVARGYSLGDAPLADLTEVVGALQAAARPDRWLGRPQPTRHPSRAARPRLPGQPAPPHPAGGIAGSVGERAGSPRGRRRAGSCRSGGGRAAGGGRRAVRPRGPGFGGRFGYPPGDGLGLAARSAARSRW